MAKVREIAVQAKVEDVVESASKVEEKVVSTPARLFVDSSSKIEDVLRFDAEGVELFFESDKGKFLVIPDEVLKKLSSMTRVRYDVSRALNAKHDPEMDGFSQRLSVGEARNRQEQVRKMLRETPGTADAVRKLTTYVGHGFVPRWARPDKVAHWLEKGADFVEAKADGSPVDPNVFTEAKAINGHFETQGTKPNETELVLMRIPIERNAKNRKELDELAQRPLKAVEAEGNRSGLSDRVAARNDLSWSER